MSNINEKIIVSVSEYISLLGGRDEFVSTLKKWNPDSHDPEILDQLNSLILSQIDNIKSEIEKRYELLSKMSTIKIKVISTD